MVDVPVRRWWLSIDHEVILFNLMAYLLKFVMLKWRKSKVILKTIVHRRTVRVTAPIITWFCIIVIVEDVWPRFHVRTRLLVAGLQAFIPWCV